MTNINSDETKLTQTISSIVIDKIDKTAIWKAAADNGDWDGNDGLQRYLRNTVLNNGKTRCDTRELANLYVYCYLLGHVDAFRVAVEPPSNLVKPYDLIFSDLYFNDFENTLIVDIGCGPGTVALALAEMWQDHEDEDQPSSLPINYLGIDIEKEMINLAEDFFNTPLFDDCIRINTTDSSIRVDNGNQVHKIIFTFNYVFSQIGVLEAVEDFITYMKQVLIEFDDVDEIYLMYSNIDYCGEKNAFLTFLHQLQEEGMLSSSQSTYIPKYAYEFRKFNNLDGSDIDLFEGTTRYVYTKIFKIYRP